jgi:hypothetical protein
VRNIWLVLGVLVCARSLQPHIVQCAEVSEKQKTLQTFSNYGRFTVIYSDEDRIVLDKNSGFYEVRKGDEVIRRGEDKFEKREGPGLLTRDAEFRKRFYSRGPVLFSLTNIVSNGSLVAAVHQLRKDVTYLRIVQILDKNMAVTALWEDELPFKTVDYSLGMEPFAFGENGEAAGLGEHGEIVVYARDGSIKKSITIKGIFNEERIPKIETIDEKLNPHISKDIVELIRKGENRTVLSMSKLMKARDQKLIGKTMSIPEFDYSNINGLFLLPNNSINVLIGSGIIYSIDMSTGATKVYNLSDIIKSKVKDEDELIYQALCRKWDLYLLTMNRVIHLRMEQGMQKLSETAIRKQEDTVNQWEVLRGIGANREQLHFVDFTHLGKRVVKLER